MPFLFRVVGHVRGDGKGGGGKAHMIHMEDHGEEGAENHKQNVVSTRVHRDVEGGWDAYSSYIHWPQAGNGVVLGGSTSNILSLCTGTGFQWRGE